MKFIGGKYVLWEIKSNQNRFKFFMDAAAVTGNTFISITLDYPRPNDIESITYNITTQMLHIETMNESVREWATKQDDYFYTSSKTIAFKNPSSKLIDNLMTQFIKYTSELERRDILETLTNKKIPLRLQGELKPLFLQDNVLEKKDDQQDNIGQHKVSSSSLFGLIHEDANSVDPTDGLVWLNDCVHPSSY